MIFYKKLHGNEFVNFVRNEYKLIKFKETSINKSLYFVKINKKKYSN